MAFEKGDRVVLHDQHSEFDGETGEITQVSETMFGDSTYIIQFEEGQEAGIAEDAIEAADGSEDADAGDTEVYAPDEDEE